jgi:predicted PurR-regulated permease PerM
MSNDESPAPAASDISAADDAAPPVPLEAPAPRTAFWTRLDRPFVVGFLLTLGGLGAIVLGLALTSLATVLIYIALAVFAALGLDPSVRFLERRGLSRPISVVVVILGLVVVFALLLWMVIPIVVDQITSFVRA